MNFQYYLYKILVIKLVKVRSPMYNAYVKKKKKEKDKKIWIGLGELAQVSSGSDPS